MTPFPLAQYFGGRILALGLRALGHWAHVPLGHKAIRTIAHWATGQARGPKARGPRARGPKARGPRTLGPKESPTNHKSFPKSAKTSNQKGGHKFSKTNSQKACTRKNTRSSKTDLRLYQIRNRCFIKSDMCFPKQCQKLKDN